MATYQGPNESRIDLELATVKMFDALAMSTKRPVKDLAADAVELVRLASIVKDKKRAATA